MVAAEDGDRIQSPKRRVLDKNRKADNAQNCVNYINIVTYTTDVW
jgi:hypothetical protein